MSRTLLVMAGGTGGHIFPALAVAEKMRARGWNVCWLGNPDGMEARLVPQHGFEMVWVKFAALRGKGLLRKLLLPLNLLRGFWQARKAISKVRPDVVLGMGGYITFPGGMMASLLGKPLVVHEQNSIAGLANRVLAGVADRILTGFPDVFKKGRWVGNPVRPEIAKIAPPAERFAGRSGALHLLVIGGSLGAQALNEREVLRLIEKGMTYDEVAEALQIILRLLRESAQRSSHSAQQGSYQQPLGGKTYQMVQVRLDEATGAIPEISANKYALNIRFILPGSVQRSVQQLVRRIAGFR